MAYMQTPTDRVGKGGYNMFSSTKALHCAASTLGFKISNNYLGYFRGQNDVVVIAFTRICLGDERVI